MKNIIYFIFTTTMTITVAIIPTIIPSDFGKVYAKMMVYQTKKAGECLNVSFNDDTNDDLLEVMVDNEYCNYPLFYSGCVVYNDKAYHVYNNRGGLAAYSRTFYYSSFSYKFPHIPRAAYDEITYKDCVVPRGSDESVCEFDSSCNLPSERPTPSSPPPPSSTPYPPSIPPFYPPQPLTHMCCSYDGNKCPFQGPPAPVGMSCTCFNYGAGHVPGTTCL